MINDWLKRIHENCPDEGGVRAAAACNSMLRFMDTAIETCTNEKGKTILIEVNKILREAAMRELVTEDLLQEALQEDRSTIYPKYLGGN